MYKIRGGFYRSTLLDPCTKSYLLSNNIFFFPATVQQSSHLTSQQPHCPRQIQWRPFPPATCAGESEFQTNYRHCWVLCYTAAKHADLHNTSGQSKLIMNLLHDAKHKATIQLNRHTSLCGILDFEVLWELWALTKGIFKFLISSGYIRT